ncbi:GTPase Era [Acidicapsa dinghuensis]|uniref:GTPase Era n=1 Tax=Acidicapsa dinghuensis TaxID=2218256 RepID=A0ABW1ECG0_9BACT|nr:GTPase Era [Acidicapsa dinghuensis]
MRSGFVSILGRPNAGKSTLLNALVGEKVAIVTSKPQTTRNRITGVLEVPAGRTGKSGKLPAAQIVFVDTPGVHKPGTQLDRRMLQEVYDALEERDIVILLVDASRQLQLDEPEAGEAHAEEAGTSPSAGPAPEGKALPRHSRGWKSEDEFVLGLIRKLDCPVFLVINKIDLVRREELLPLIERLRQQHAFTEVIPISARKRDGLDMLLTKLIEYLPQGERYFPPEQFTDQPERFLVAELIRERILMETGEEVPYASAVVIERFEEPPPESTKPKKPRPIKGGGFAAPKLPLTSIAAAIYCERDGQKAILIGKGGSKLKAIGAGARKEIESLLGTRVYLELRVIVEPGWRESRGFIETLDWRKQMEEMAARQAVEEPDKNES